MLLVDYEKLFELSNEDMNQLKEEFGENIEKADVVMKRVLKYIFQDWERTLEKTYQEKIPNKTQTSIEQFIEKISKSYYTKIAKKLHISKEFRSDLLFLLKETGIKFWKLKDQRILNQYFI